MSRFSLRSLALVSTLGALALPGCSIDLGAEDWEFDCLFDPLATAIASGFSQPVLGQAERAQIGGLCGIFDACDATSPLAAGATYFTFAVGTGVDGAVVEDLTVASGPASLEAEGSCGTVQGSLRADAVGTIELVAEGAEGEVDRFTLEVARATQGSMRLEAEAIGSYPATILVSAELRDDASRLLAPGDLPVWQLADDGLLSLDEGASGRGATLVLTANGPGTTELRFVAGGVEVVETLELPAVDTP